MKKKQTIMEPIQPSINVTNRINGLWKVPFLVLFGTLVYMAALAERPAPVEEAALLPVSGTAVTLPIVWGDLGKKMIETGVIDGARFEALYASRGDLPAAEKVLIRGNQDMPVTMTEENAGILLNLLWGVGLANRNPILESGPISDPRYGSAGRFASTGGFSIAVGDPMNHFNQHSLIELKSEEQLLVARVAKGIYRPCCDDSTHFPDCNHGMAMLGLLELMAANGVEESEMYRVALAVNRLWFPGEYEVIEKFLEGKGLSLAKADPREILGKEFSSISEFRRILAAATIPSGPELGGSCSV